jgi:integrase
MIETLPSGSLRVKVYAGYDPLTGRRRYLCEVIPAGPRAGAEAEKARTRLQHQVDEQRNPKTRATVNQLLDAYLEVVDVEPTTKIRYEGDIRRHIRPAFGKLQLGRVTPEVLDRFYAQLRACRERCDGKGHTRHRTYQAHVCDERCCRKECKPLSASSIRSIHWVISAAFDKAVRWRWTGHNPADDAEPPSPPQSNPSPPSPAEAARLLTESWKDDDWGAFVWTAMITGARRGELCALLRSDLDLDARVLSIHASIKPDEGTWVRRDTKAHQQRRITLDPDTVYVLRGYLERADARAAALGVQVCRDAYLFSLSPDASAHLIPSTVSQRYDRMAERLKIETTFHKLRHFSATELIAAGVDIRTIAGRLGHGGGGTTTLKVYAAWVSEADQRAASALADRLPTPRP